MMKFSEKVQEVLDSAAEIAVQNEHEYITPEHLLSAILLEPKSQKWISGAGGNIMMLKKDLENFFAKRLEKISGIEHPSFSLLLANLLTLAEQQSQCSDKNEVQLDHLLISFFYLEDNSSFALYFLKKAGVEEFALVQQVAHDSIFFGSDDNFQIGDDGHATR